ncbi:MAG: DUF4258 domain-containing protein [Proteobacteria bacterium]|nr:DUF4258 domain-containing protein [Pseudomonadota bacterium]
MKSPIYSLHAQRRMQQRGIRKDDVDLLRRCGTCLDDQSLFLRKQDVAREISKRKKEIQALERLSGCKVVLSGDVVLTVYHATRKHQKALIRRYR